MTTSERDNTPVFALTLPNGEQIPATYGDRLFVGYGGDVNTSASRARMVEIGQAGDAWLSAVALEILVNPSNVAVYVNQREPGLLIADEEGASARVNPHPAKQRRTARTTTRNTYLTSRALVDLTLVAGPGSSNSLPVGSLWFLQQGWSDYRSRTKITVEDPPRTMWMRVITAAALISRHSGKDATWPQVHAYLYERCPQHAAYKENGQLPASRQQYTMHKAAEFYGLRPDEWDEDKPWNTVQAALRRDGWPTDQQIAYVENHLCDPEPWMPYGRRRPGGGFT